MKRYVSYLVIIAFVGLSSLDAHAQAQADSYKLQLSRASTAAELERVLKTAENDGLKRTDLLDLRYAIYLEIRQRVSDGTLNANEKNSLARLSLKNEGRLIAELEDHLAELLRSSPNSQETSRTAVRLAQLLPRVRILKSSAKERGASIKERQTRVKELYRKALRIETKLDPTSPDSLALQVLLADAYMESADFEEALPLYEEYLGGVERQEGKLSKVRVRALFMLAQIAELAYDIERFEALKKELSEFGIGYERSLFINRRIETAKKGSDDSGGLVRLETGSPLRLITNRPDRIYPPTERITLQSSDMVIRVDPEVSITSISKSAGHPAIVKVDADGNVADVEILSPESPKEKVAALIKQWKFRPLVYKGVRSPMQGLVHCWIVD